MEEEGAGKEEEGTGKCAEFSISIRFSAWKNFSCCMSMKLSPSSEIPTFLAAFRIVLGVAHLSHISANDNMKASRFIVISDVKRFSFATLYSRWMFLLH